MFRGEMPRPIVAGDDAATISAIEGATGVIGLVSATAAKSLPSDVAPIAIE